MSTRQFFLLVVVLVVTQSFGFGLLLNHMPTTSNHDQDKQLLAALNLQNQALQQLRALVAAQTGNSATGFPQALVPGSRNATAWRRGGADTSSQSNPPAASQPAPTPSSEQLEAADQAMNVVNTAIANGVWTQQDNQSLMPYTLKLTHAQRVELINHFAQALQNKQIILQGPPPVM